MNQGVILSLDPSILWELDCAFYSENAASANMRQKPLAELKRVDAFQTMFAEVVFTQGVQVERSDLAISPAYPTHPQAEVLVCEPIKPRYISEVIFCDDGIRSRWIAENGTD